MAVIVMVYGKSGSGKSTSLRNFRKGEISVINVSRKPFPFRADFTSLATDNYEQIRQAVSTTASPSICIDDATYLLVDEFMRNAKVTGYQKFTDMALNFFNLVKFCNDELDGSRIVYFLGHSDTSETGDEHFKTVGKLLDEKVTLEGLFTVVLKTVVQDHNYLFATQTNGQDTVKSPMDMFDRPLIPNDLKAVDDIIRGFWNIPRAAANKSRPKFGSK
jgi:hypothetical protein